MLYRLGIPGLVSGRKYPACTGPDGLQGAWKTLVLGFFGCHYAWGRGGRGPYLLLKGSDEAFTEHLKPQILYPAKKGIVQEFHDL